VLGAQLSQKLLQLSFEIGFPGRELRPRGSGFGIGGVFYNLFLHLLGGLFDQRELAGKRRAAIL